ncbi:hypothetical protein OVA24_17020 [Luteolibacter sp. SL250]|uniref:hypothetical protein n=1 Tax=Luteolibacter sp. SL250 TaxID=2995170 RepID=UPI00226DAC9F|nr:hypothetical protein [Luteolibacter sp. SL250]WAC18936.1 hypothetical protein OVA24_17020 [Luteolibacter sp. SL250]
MANLPSNNTITTTGSYDIPRLIPGREYLLTLRTSGTASAFLSFDDGPSGSFSAVQAGAMLGANPSEARVVAPSGTLRINVTSTTTPIRVNLVPVL